MMALSIIPSWLHLSIYHRDDPLAIGAGERVSEEGCISHTSDPQVRLYGAHPYRISYHSQFMMQR